MEGGANQYKGTRVGASSPRYSHHAWLLLPVVVRNAGLFSVVQRQTSWTISFLRRSRRPAVLMEAVSRGRRRRFEHPVGMVRLMPPDEETYIYRSSVLPGDELCQLQIPPEDVAAIFTEEGLDGTSLAGNCRHLHDPRILACLQRFSGDRPADGARVNAIDRDTAARDLLLAIHENLWGQKPDWAQDCSAFSRRTMQQLVDLIASRLDTPPTVAELAALHGLSPSHFARLFRRSTGTSLGRFIVRQRIQASLNGLAADIEPLATIATDLGFASQSHFTRCFSELTGMTPGRYRRQHRRTSI